jgi:hypothetical protein
MEDECFVPSFDGVWRLPRDWRGDRVASAMAHVRYYRWQADTRVCLSRETFYRYVSTVYGTGETHFFTREPTNNANYLRQN